MHNPYKEKEARSRGNNKRTKTVKFDGATKGMNTMKSHDGSIPKNRKGKNQKKKPNSDQANLDPSEDERIYGIDRLKLGEPAHDLENDSK